jgi:hypothetical protein
MQAIRIQLFGIAAFRNSLIIGTLAKSDLVKVASKSEVDQNRKPSIRRAV